MSEPIAAIATPPVPSAIGIVRVSERRYRGRVRRVPRRQRASPGRL